MTKPKARGKKATRWYLIDSKQSLSKTDEIQPEPTDSSDVRCRKPVLF
jgi:hypothetical protein